MTFHNINGAFPAVRIAAFGSDTRPTGGIYRWMTPYVRLIGEYNPEFASRVLNLHRSELHFIGLCLAVMGDNRNDRDHLGAFARGVGKYSRKNLLLEAGRVGGIEIKPSLAKVATRLAGNPWRPATYRRLAVLYNEPHARKVLSHLPKVTRRHVITLNRLPATFRTRGVLKMIRRPRELSEVLFSIEIVRRVRTDLDDRRIVVSLERAESCYIRDWVEAHYKCLPFPAAPTGVLTSGSGGVLRPLDTYKELARAAREFSNCIENYVGRVLTGRSYFYRCDHAGRRVAVAELKPAPGIGWAVDEVLGPDNNSVPGCDREWILRCFREGGVTPAPHAINPRNWYDLE